jgi:hypothetical protein
MTRFADRLPTKNPMAAKLARLRDLRSNPRPPIPQHEIEAHEHAGILAELDGHLNHLRRTMVALGGAQWAAERIEAEAFEARKAANLHPN